jgi:hypothetical protein
LHDIVVEKTSKRLKHTFQQLARSIVVGKVLEAIEKMCAVTAVGIKGADQE